MNPYAPPRPAIGGAAGAAGPAGEWVACPRCGSGYVSRPTFTWWGGLVGPRIIKEVKCNGCGHRYNGRTGGPNTLAIALYLTVVLTLIFGMLVALGIAIFFYQSP